MEPLELVLPSLFNWRLLMPACPGSCRVPLVHLTCRGGSGPPFCCRGRPVNISQEAPPSSLQTLYQWPRDPKVWFLLLGRANGPPNLALAPQAGHLCPSAPCSVDRSAHRFAGAGDRPPFSENPPHRSLPSVSMRSSEKFTHASETLLRGLVFLYPHPIAL